jgi:hypothetical protein
MTAMAGLQSDCGAFDETVVFLRYFKDLPDSRQAAKVVYPLDEVLLLSLLAVLAGAETIVDIARFGKRSSTSCAGFVPFAGGRLPTITSATSLPRLMPSLSSAALWRGSDR